MGYLWFACDCEFGQVRCVSLCVDVSSVFVCAGLCVVSGFCVLCLTLSGCVCGC